MQAAGSNASPTPFQSEGCSKQARNSSDSGMLAIAPPNFEIAGPAQPEQISRGTAPLWGAGSAERRTGPRT
eukprot:11272514-Alexandrium_andersonii.AAC.1